MGQRKINPILKKIVGDRIDAEMKRAGVTQYQLSKELGSITQAGLSRIRSGKNLPSLEMLIEFAVRFSVSTDYLLGRTEHRRER